MFVAGHVFGSENCHTGGMLLSFTCIYLQDSGSGVGRAQAFAIEHAFQVNVVGILSHTQGLLFGIHPHHAG